MRLTVVAEGLARFDDFVLEQQTEDPRLEETQSNDDLEAHQLCKTSSGFHTLLHMAAEFQDRSDARSD